MPITEGKRAQELVKFLEYVLEKNEIYVKDIPDISKVLRMSERKLYSLINILVGMHMLESDKNRTVYTPNKEKGRPPFEYTKPERFLRGYYRATGQAKTKVAEVAEVAKAKTVS